MSYLLRRIEDWADRANQANWSVTELATQCGVSVRTLQVYFNDTMREPPQSWMNRERQRRAIDLLRAGSTVKEVAGILGYKTQHAFSRAFKAYHGYPPIRYRNVGCRSNFEGDIAHLDISLRA